MTAKSNLAQKVPVDIALVVYGTDRSRKPHASRFGADAAKSAQAAARAMGMRTLRIVSDEQRVVARRLPKGTMSAKGRTVVPLVQPALYQKLLAVVGADPAAPPPSPPASPGKKPAAVESGSDARERWAKLATGSPVLAFEEGTGWWEAIVQHRDGDTLTLTWRDYPDQPKFNCNVVLVALLHPDFVSPW